MRDRHVIVLHSTNIVSSYHHVDITDGRKLKNYKGDCLGQFQLTVLHQNRKSDFGFVILFEITSHFNVIIHFPTRGKDKFAHVLSTAP
jgi:hypothetical protein